MNFRRLSKYICTAGLIAAMSVTTMGAVTISDVASSHWAYSAITDLEERGIMVLTSSGQFLPNQTMNFFEVADVVAKATGYVDIEIATGIDATFKEQVKANYENQKATLETYAKKYKTWNSAYNQQIAYLLGRGYMTTSDLDQFVTKSDKGETKNVVTKEQFAVYLVRMLGKEKTATTTYKTTTFKDDSSLKATNKPYVAYLSSVGIIKPDAAGKANGSMKVTKALCAKMISEALKIKDTSTIGKVQQTAPSTGVNGTINTDTTVTTPSSNTSGIYTIDKVRTKNATEYYVSLKDATGKISYYSLKNTTKILDTTGAELAITKLVSGATVNVTIELQGETEYITSIQLTNQALNTPVINTPTTNTPITNVPIQNTIPGTSVVATTAGTLLSNISNDVIRITLPDGTSKSYLVSDTCRTVLDATSVSTYETLRAGDTVVLTIENSLVTQIIATSGNGIITTPSTTNSLSEGEIIAKKFAGNNYIYTIKQGSTEQQVTVPTSVQATRNNKKVDLSEIRIGDTVKLTKSNHTIESIVATGKKTTVEGIIKGICVSANTEIVVSVNNTEVTYTLAADVEVYDHNTNEYTNVRNLHLGQEVTIMLESMEAISIDVEKTASTYNLMGTIIDIGRRYDYIDVLVDYDYVSGESKVYKRITLPEDLVVVINGRNKSCDDLEEDMDIVINYKYLDDTMPEKILVI
ncbi:MAG: S-layer homology domain-containing protein [Cellulosilyticum sp.]|nr:S-layer homology domain-containing protein [Cellulosilyticum sp.]